MSRPTNEQLRFARTMSARQKATLSVLAEYPCPLSASERGDPELYALVQHRLAQCTSTHPHDHGPFLWFATEAGKTIARQAADGKAIVKKQAAGEI